MRLVVILLVVAAAAPRASADPADDQVAQGEQAGRDGSWTLAIDHFKAADKLAPRAKHACLIGLAYSRRELWAEAELFFELCHARASPADPIPDWLADAEHQLADKLAASGAASITITVASADASVTVSTFAPGESFAVTHGAPHTIHLPLGTHVVTIAAPGYATERREVVVVDAKPQTFTVALHTLASKSYVPWYVIGAGAALGVVAIGYDELVVQPIRDRVNASSYQYEYDRAKIDVAGPRTTTIVLFASATIVAAAGAALKYTIYRDREQAPVRVGALLTPTSAGIAIEWVPR